jgi:methyl-accepting chemotaxis protein
MNGAPYLFVYSKLSIGDIMVCTLVPESMLLAQTAEIKLLSIVLTILVAVLALVIGSVISHRMLGTIQYILRQLRKVSSGDLTVHLTSNRKDEFALLCDGINETVSNVKELIVHVNEVSGQLNEAAAYVNNASYTFVETSNDIQNVVSELEVGVNKLDSGSEDCLNQMDSLSGKISNVSVNADEIGKLTSETGSTITMGITSVQGLTESAQSTTAITQSVIAAIEELEEQSNSIHKIVQDINEIAEQTNLLSLNATIEAAHAGDAGRGFAVVAEEIRKLSDQCQSSAGKISDMITEIVGKTQGVVDIARHAEDVIESQTDAVENTTNSFKMIDQQVESLLRALGTISTNVEEMSSSRNETLAAIEMISSVSAEAAACTTSVFDTAGTQLKAVQELEQASEQLRSRSDRLLEIMGAFQI